MTFYTGIGIGVLVGIVAGILLALLGLIVALWYLDKHYPAAISMAGSGFTLGLEVQHRCRKRVASVRPETPEQARAVVEGVLAELMQEYGHEA